MFFYHVLYPIHYTLSHILSYTLYHILYIIYSIPYTLYHILYTIYSIPYAKYHIRIHMFMLSFGPRILESQRQATRAGRGGKEAEAERRWDLARRDLSPKDRINI